MNVTYQRPEDATSDNVQPEIFVFPDTDGDTEQLLAQRVAEGFYRLWESPVFSEMAAYGQIIEVERAANAWRFLRVAGPSGLKTYRYLAPTGFVDSSHWQHFRARLKAVGGEWEQVFGGLLVLHVPYDSGFPLEQELRDAISLASTSDSAPTDSQGADNVGSSSDVHEAGASQLDPIPILDSPWGRTQVVQALAAGCVYVSEGSRIPRKVRVPRKRPRTARFLGSVAWNWSPAGSRVDDLYISMDRSRRYWMLWIDNTDADYALSRLGAYMPRGALTTKSAARRLVVFYYAREEQEFHTLGPWEVWEPGQLSKRELRTIGEKLWPA